MKINKVSIFAVCAVLALAFAAGCQRDDDLLFEHNASQRLQTTIQDVKDILEGNSNGWAIEYFAGNSEVDYGGRNFAAIFKSGVAEVAFEDYPDTTLKSLYKLTNDNGPVLSFDTYNEFMHYFATPGTSFYQAKGGDFEFTILDYTDEVITMRGKRSGKKIRMYALKESMKSYIKAINEANDNFIVAYINGTVGADSLKATFDLDYRLVNFVSDTTSVVVPFITTKDGIKLYEDVKVAGVEFSVLNYDPATMVFTLPDVGVATNLQGSLPADYTPYDLFEGTYTFNYWNESAVCTVRLTKGPDRTYIMTGLSNYYQITLIYDKTYGRLHWNSQQIGTTSSGNAIWLCGWDADKGSLSWSTSCGMETVWNMDTEHPVFTFVTNNFEGVHATSFIFWEISSEGSVGWFQKNGYDPYNRYYFPFLNNLTKI